MTFAFVRGVKSIALATLAAAALSACLGGGDDGGPVTLVAQDLPPITINASTGPSAVSALIAASSGFSFPSGVPALGTGSPTTLTIAGTSSTPTFSVTSSQGTASGNLSFGSCIFTITSSTFQAPHPLALGETLTVSPCSIDLDTAGKLGGTAANVSTTLTLGTTPSQSTTIVVTVSNSGQMLVNGTAVGTVTMQPSTGTGTSNP